MIEALAFFQLLEVVVLGQPLLVHSVAGILKFTFPIIFGSMDVFKKSSEHFWLKASYHRSPVTSTHSAYQSISQLSLAVQLTSWELTGPDVGLLTTRCHIIYVLKHVASNANPMFLSLRSTQCVSYYIRRFDHQVSPGHLLTEVQMDKSRCLKLDRWTYPGVPSSKYPGVLSWEFPVS